MALENSEEFHKRYNNTWVRYKHPHRGEIPALVMGVDFNAGTISLETELGAFTVECAKYDKWLNLDAPEVGYFNYNGHGMFLYRQPARQFRRGMCSDNFEIYNPFHRLFNKGVYVCRIGKAAINDIFNRKFPADPGAAVAMFGQYVQSVAISEHLMLSKSPIKKDFPLIWFDANPVGYVMDQKFVVGDELFEQEVSDELRRLGHHRWMF